MKKEIRTARKKTAEAGLKLALAIIEIEDIENEQWVSKDKKLSEMLHDAQALCHEICVYIDNRCEPRPTDPIIHLIKEANDDLIAAGYEGPGWYFWDETDAYCHGPFSTRDEASDACREYAKNL